MVEQICMTEFSKTLFSGIYVGKDILKHKNKKDERWVVTLVKLKLLGQLLNMDELIKFLIIKKLNIFKYIAIMY